MEIEKKDVKRWLSIFQHDITAIELGLIDEKEYRKSLEDQNG